MKTIKLTQGREALVDDCDYAFLMQWKWYFSKRKRDGYAERTVAKPKQHIYMHRAVAARKGLEGKIDHKDRYRLNNQRPNLRQATGRQNQGNRYANSRKTSKFKGVCWNKQRDKWRTQCKTELKRLLLDFPGTRRGEIEAAYAYDVAALKFGEFACINRVGHLLDSRTKRRIRQDVIRQLPEN